MIDTVTGQYGLLNYYGYALFFYHTLSAWSGQTVHLPKRHLQFQPHHTAFDSSGTAVLPILLGGELGTATITQNTATIEMLLMKRRAFSFRNITICQHVFAVGGQPHTILLKQPLVLTLPSPCDTAAKSVRNLGAYFSSFSALQYTVIRVWADFDSPLAGRIQSLQHTVL